MWPLAQCKQRRCPLMNLTSNSTKILLTTSHRDRAKTTWAESRTGKSIAWGLGKKLVR